MRASHSPRNRARQTRDKEQQISPSSSRRRRRPPARRLSLTRVRRKSRARGRLARRNVRVARFPGSPRSMRRALLRPPRIRAHRAQSSPARRRLSRRRQHQARLQQSSRRPSNFRPRSLRPRRRSRRQSSSLRRNRLRRRPNRRQSNWRQRSKRRQPRSHRLALRRLPPSNCRHLGSHRSDRHARSRLSVPRLHRHPPLSSSRRNRPRLNSSLRPHQARFRRAPSADLRHRPRR